MGVVGVKKKIDPQEDAKNREQSFFPEKHVVPGLDENLRKCVGKTHDGSVL
jgi:hypothetical protein